MVWDTIYGRDVADEPVEEWGGIAYALAGLECALPPDWEIVPLVKVGRDLATEANAFLRQLTRRAGAARFIEVPEPTNRVTLRYASLTRRTETLAGGVPGWRWAELGPLVRDLDALYVNFIAGWELDLDTAMHLRHGFQGPIYGDLHSLLLDVGQHGRRTPRRLPRPDDWFACFDVVQLNETELSLIGDDPMHVAARALAAGVDLVVVTLGARGAAYFTSRPFRFGAPHPRGAAGPVETARIAAPAPCEEGDTTGCGDVFGATLVARLLAGDDVESAIREANAAGGRNVHHRGASRLHYHLRGQIAPQ